MIREKHELKVEGDSKEKGPNTEKDLDMAMVVLVRGTKSSRLSRERRGRNDEAEVGILPSSMMRLTFLLKGNHRQTSRQHYQLLPKTLMRIKVDF